NPAMNDYLCEFDLCNQCVNEISPGVYCPKNINSCSYLGLSCTYISSQNQSSSSANSNLNTQNTSSSTINIFPNNQNTYPINNYSSTNTYSSSAVTSSTYPSSSNDIMNDQENQNIQPNNNPISPQVTINFNMNLQDEQEDTISESSNKESVRNIEEPKQSFSLTERVMSAVKSISPKGENINKTKIDSLNQDDSEAIKRRELSKSKSVFELSPKKKISFVLSFLTFLEVILLIYLLKVLKSRNYIEKNSSKKNDEDLIKKEVIGKKEKEANRTPNKKDRRG
ncbi:MAG: hypothetical protein QXJ28_03205, partial [Candidatus Pacearchaeota archaeon]